MMKSANSLHCYIENVTLKLLNCLPPDSLLVDTRFIASHDTDRMPIT